MTALNYGAELLPRLPEGSNISADTFYLARDFLIHCLKLHEMPDSDGLLKGSAAAGRAQHPALTTINKRVADLMRARGQEIRKLASIYPGPHTYDEFLLLVDWNGSWEDIITVFAVAGLLVVRSAKRDYDDFLVGVVCQWLPVFLDREARPFLDSVGGFQNLSVTELADPQCWLLPPCVHTAVKYTYPYQ